MPIRSVLACLVVLGWATTATAQQPVQICDGIDCVNVTGTNALEVTGEYTNNFTAPGAGVYLPILPAVSTAAAPTYTENRMVGLSVDLSGALRVTGISGGGGGDATAANQLTQITSLQLIDNLPNTIGSTTAGQSGALNFGAVTTAAPTYTTAQSHPLSLQADGSLRAAITNTLTVASHAVTNAGTFPVQADTECAAALAAGDTMGNPTTCGHIAFNAFWDPVGAVWKRATGVTDPCDGSAKTPFVFSIAAATTTQLIPASSTNKAYICNLTLISAAADNIALVESATAACPSGIVGMSGGNTSATGWNLDRGGLINTGGGGTAFQTASTNRYVCFITSTTSQVSGNGHYVLAP